MNLDRLDAFRRSVSFKWWLIYDVLIAAGMIALFGSLHGWELLLPFALALALAFSAALDVIEFFVKRRMERDVDEFMAAQAREAKARNRPVGTLRDRLNVLRNEVDCRIEHGAESGGHLEYVRDQLDKIGNG